MHFISLVDVSNTWTNCIFHWKLPLVIITIHMETCCSVFGMITCWLCFLVCDLLCCTWAEFILTKRWSWAWQCPAKVQAAKCVMVTQHRWWCWSRVKFSLSTYSSQCSMCSLESSEVCSTIYITGICLTMFLAVENWKWRPRMCEQQACCCISADEFTLQSAVSLCTSPAWGRVWKCTSHYTEKKKNASKKLSSEQQRRYSKLVLTDFCSLCGSPMECNSRIYTLSTIAHCPWHSLGWYPLAFRQTKTLEKLKYWHTYTEADLIQSILSFIKLGVAKLYHDTMQHCTMQCEDVETIISRWIWLSC